MKLTVVKSFSVPDGFLCFDRSGRCRWLLSGPFCGGCPVPSKIESDWDKCVRCSGMCFIFDSSIFGAQKCVGCLSAMKEVAQLAFAEEVAQ